MRKAVANLLACVAIVAIAPAVAMGQGSQNAVYKVSHNAFGQPDLQGYWGNATMTRLERDTKYGERRAMTKEEAASIEGATAERNARLNAPTDKATIDGWATRTGADNADECQSGSRGAACGYNAGWTDPGSTIMRVGGEPRTSFITFPANGRVPAPIGAAAAGGGRGGRGAPPAAAGGAPGRGAALAAARAGRGGGDDEGGEGDNRPARPGQNDNPEGRSLGERCIMSFGSSSGPIMQPQLYNNTYQFVQSRDSVAIMVEMVHDVRIVRLNSKHRTDGVRPWMGDSIGWYEGDTLVVETTNYHPRQNLRGSSANLKMTERFTRVRKDRLLYQFKVEDPTVWAQPWGGEYEFAATGPVYEYACHEGNYGLEGILAGARHEEAEAAAAARAKR